MYDVVDSFIADHGHELATTWVHLEPGFLSGIRHPGGYTALWMYPSNGDVSINVHQSIEPGICTDVVLGEYVDRC
jgi:hypothetical protein